MDEVLTTEASGRTVYELGFLLVPEITEEKLPEAFGTLKATLLDMGAVEVSEEFPKNLQLAYTMEKTVNNKILRYTEAWFGWIKFELESETLAQIEAKLRGDTNIVRFLLTKTVRENTLAAKRAFGTRRRTKSTTNEEPAPEMSKEEIDREIEALVEDNKEEA